MEFERYSPTVDTRSNESQRIDEELMALLAEAAAIRDAALQRDAVDAETTRTTTVEREGATDEELTALLAEAAAIRDAALQRDAVDAETTRITTVEREGAADEELTALLVEAAAIRDAALDTVKPSVLVAPDPDVNVPPGAGMQLWALPARAAQWPALAIPLLCVVSADNQGLWPLPPQSPSSSAQTHRGLSNASRWALSLSAILALIGSGAVAITLATLKTSPSGGAHSERSTPPAALPSAAPPPAALPPTFVMVPLTTPASAPPITRPRTSTAPPVEAALLPTQSTTAWAAFGNVYITAPPGTILSVDGTYAGTAPASLSLPQGTHAIVGMHPESGELRQSVEVRPYGRVEVRLGAAQSPGTVAGSSERLQSSP